MPFNITNSVGRYAKNISVSGSLWVATGGTGGNVIVTSKSGTNWAKASITGLSGQSVAYGNNTWVAVGADKIVFSTNNASTWADAASNASATSLYRVAYGKDNLGANLWIAVNNSNSAPAIIKSINGNNWSASNLVAEITYTKDVAYGKDASNVGLWVAVGSKIVTSTDGNNWYTATATAGSIFNSPACVAYGKDASGVGLWVAGAGSGSRTLAYSYSGTSSWTDIQFSTTNIFALAYGKDASGAGLWIATGGQSIFKSTNGINWINTNTTILTGINAYGIANGTDASGQNLWIVVGSTSTTGNAIVSSPNGTTWSRVAANGGIDYPNGVAFKA